MSTTGPQVLDEHSAADPHRHCWPLAVPLGRHAPTDSGLPLESSRNVQHPLAAGQSFDVEHDCAQTCVPVPSSMQVEPLSQQSAPQSGWPPGQAPPPPSDVPPPPLLPPPPPSGELPELPPEAPELEPPMMPLLLPLPLLLPPPLPGAAPTVHAASGPAARRRERTNEAERKPAWREGVVMAHPHRNARAACFFERFAGLPTGGEQVTRNREQNLLSDSGRRLGPRPRHPPASQPLHQRASRHAEHVGGVALVAATGREGLLVSRRVPPVGTGVAARDEGGGSSIIT